MALASLSVVTILLLNCGRGGYIIITGTEHQYHNSQHPTAIALGAVTISPSGTASACRGDQLELTCDITGRFLEWSFPLIPEGDTTARRYARVLNPNSPTSALEVNSITFTFSIIYAGPGDSLPLTSRLLISQVSDGLNGTEVNCTDVRTSETVSTIVKTISEDFIFGRLFTPNWPMKLCLCLAMPMTAMVAQCMVMHGPGHGWLICL